MERRTRQLGTIVPDDLWCCVLEGRCIYKRGPKLIRIYKEKLEL